MGVYVLAPSLGCREPCVMDAWKSQGAPVSPGHDERISTLVFFFFFSFLSCSEGNGFSDMGSEEREQLLGCSPLSRSVMQSLA